MQLSCTCSHPRRPLHLSCISLSNNSGHTVHVSLTLRHFNTTHPLGDACCQSEVNEIMLNSTQFTKLKEFLALMEPEMLDLKPIHFIDKHMADLKEDYFYRGRAIIILVPYGYIVPLFPLVKIFTIVKASTKNKNLSVEFPHNYVRGLGKNEFHVKIISTQWFDFK